MKDRRRVLGGDDSQLSNNWQVTKTFEKKKIKTTKNRNNWRKQKDILNQNIPFWSKYFNAIKKNYEFEFDFN